MVDEDSITRQKSWSNLAELSAFLSLIHQKIFMYFEQEGIVGKRRKNDTDDFTVTGLLSMTRQLIKK